MPLTTAEIKALYKGMLYASPFLINERPADSEFLTAVIADNASTAGSPFISINMQQIKELLPFINRTSGKIDKELAVGYNKPFAPSEGGEFSPYCEDADQIEYATRAFRFSGAVRTSAKVGSVLCDAQTYQEKREATLRALIAKHLQALTDSFNTDFFGNIAQHVGSLPRLSASTAPRVKGEALPLFHLPVAGFGAALNQLGLNRMRTDIRYTRVTQANYAVMSNSAMAFADAMAAQGIYRQDGINPQNLAAQSPIGRMIPSDSIAQFTGLPKAIMIVPQGFLKLVTLAINKLEYGQVGNFGNQTRTTIIDPIFNLEHDFVVEQKLCGETVEEVFYLTIRYGILSMPQCDNNTPALQDVNGILLYNAVCSNDTICDLGTEGYVNPFELTPSEKCADINVEVCAPVCSVEILEIERTATKIVLQAVATGAQGATNAITYAWTVDGTPNAEDGSVLSLLLSGLTTGDTIDVEITDSTGCEAVSTFEYIA